jgi:hypothetical protein
MGDGMDALRVESDISRWAQFNARQGNSAIRWHQSMAPLLADHCCARRAVHGSAHAGASGNAASGTLLKARCCYLRRRLSRLTSHGPVARQVLFSVSSWAI